MSSTRGKPCPRCGGTIRPEEAFCPACLLQAVTDDAPGQEAERLFQAALKLPPNARVAFIRQETRADLSLGSAVEMLLLGYEEAGGDAAHSLEWQEPWPRKPLPIPIHEESGAVFGHFRLLYLIGEGGMGSVWRAEQTEPVKRMVALKVIKLGMDTREVVRRFERERQTLALLNHSGIAQVYEAGSTETGRPYFAMELVEGQSITTYSERQELDLISRLKLIRAVCAVVEHAHQKGVIHRDLKPSNILVAGGVVKVIDFGVAKATQDIGEAPFFTRQAQILGTPAYMSPEQARSAGVDIDTRTDVYALGVILYELLTGVLPIDSSRLAATSIVEMQRIILEVEPPTPSTRVATASFQTVRPFPYPSGQASSLRGDLDWIVMKAIRKDRNERYSGAAALSEDIRRYLEGQPVSAAPPTLLYQLGKFVKRNRASVASGALILAALLSGLVVSLFEIGRTNQALAGMEVAHNEATFTLADMYTRSGLAAAEAGDASRAELWFANAAILGARDPARTSANRLRTTTWRSEAMTSVRAFDTGFQHLRQILWNPHHAALIVEGQMPLIAQVWELANERLWQPSISTNHTCAAWDHSGDRLAVMTRDGLLRVLEFPSGRELARLVGISAINLEWSPDNRLIAAGDVLWDWRADERRSLPQSAWCIHFSPDGRLVLLQAGSHAGVCSVSSPGRFLHPPVPAHSGDSSFFMGDGQRYVVGRPSGGLTIHDSETGVLVEAYTNGITSDQNGMPLGVSPKGRFVSRQNLPLLDLSHPGDTKLPLHQGQFQVARFSPDGALLASGGYDARLELWSLKDGTFLGEVGHHHTAVVNLEFSPDGRFVASGEDGLVRVWNVSHPELVRQIPASRASLAMISPDGKLVAASGFSNQGAEVKETRAFEIATGRPAGPAIAPGGLIMDGTFNHDGAWVALAVSTTRNRTDSGFEKSGGSGNIQLWNPLTGAALGEPISMPSEPRGLCLHPSEPWMGVCCAGGEGVEINLSNRAVRVLFNARKSVNAGASLNNGRCAYSPDGRLFAAWGLYQFIHLYNRQEGREIIKAFEPDSNTFDLACFNHTIARAVVAPSMRIEFLDQFTGVEVAPSIPYINWPFLTRFNTEGSLLLTAGGGKTAQVWDWRKGQLICPMLSHEDTVMGGCFLPGTPYLITGGHDGKIKFWDSGTGMLIRPPLQRDGWVLDLQLTPDHRSLIACGFLNGHIEIIDLAPLQPAPDLNPEDARALAEIDADAEIHPGGGLAPLTPQAGLKKWQEFRQRFPNYPGHRLGE